IPVVLFVLAIAGDAPANAMTMPILEMRVATVLQVEAQSGIKKNQGMQKAEVDRRVLAILTRWRTWLFVKMTQRQAKQAGLPFREEKAKSSAGWNPSRGAWACARWA